jgi:hypothetical protein
MSDTADDVRPPRPDFTRRAAAFARAIGVTLDHLMGLLESYDLRLIDGEADG